MNYWKSRIVRPWITPSLFIVTVLCLLLSLHDASAQSISLETITFTANHKGLELLDAYGSGSHDDPYVVVERITGEGPAILTISSVTASFGSREFLYQGYGFALVKIVENGTQQPWPNFELELRELIDLPSDRLDGLSFGQATGADRRFKSDRFPFMRSHREPYDGLYFSGGIVEPGERVSIHLVVTDYSPVETFFLLQHRDVPIAQAPSNKQIYQTADRNGASLLLKGRSLSSLQEGKP